MLIRSRSEKLFTVFAWLLFLVFAASVINHAFFFMLDADEAYNATTAKNWLLGYGYSSSIGVIFPFDPYISSGPAYTFLVAIPIKIFGNDPDVIKPFMALVHTSLLGLFFYLVRPLLGSASRFFSFVLFCTGFFCITEFRFWHRSGGELLSLLFLVNASVLLALSWQKKSLFHAFFAGLFAVLAVLTKNQMWLCLSGLLAAMLAATAQDLLGKHVHWTKVVQMWVVFFLAFSPIMCAWWLYESAGLARFASENPELYDYYLGKQWHFFSTHGSGLNLFWEIHSFPEFFKREGQLIDLAFRKFSSGFSRFGEYKAWGAAGLLLAVISSIVMGFIDFFRARDPQYLFFSMPLLAFFSWAFFLNNSVFMHQMLPGIWLAVLVCGVFLLRMQWLVTALGAFAVAVMCATANQFGELSCMEIGNNAACVYTKPNPVWKSRQQALAYLETHSLPAPLANCGWFYAHDIEFSLPGVNNIQDCMRILDDAVDFDANAFVAVNKLPADFLKEKSKDELIKFFVHKRKNIFGANFVAPVTWNKPIEFTFVANVYMVGEGLEFKRYVMDFLKYCDDKLFVDEYYYIQHCKFENIQSYVEEWKGLPIFTHEWEALYYRDFLKDTRSKTPVGWFDK